MHEQEPKKETQLMKKPEPVQKKEPKKEVEPKSYMSKKEVTKIVKLLESDLIKIADRHEPLLDFRSRFLSPTHKAKAQLTKTSQPAQRSFFTQGSKDRYSITYGQRKPRNPR